MARPLTLILDEKHLLDADKSRTDIGSSVLSTIFSTGAKRGLRVILCNQALSGMADQIMANIGYRIFTRLPNPKCLWLAQQSMRLNPAQADKVPRLEKREVIVVSPENPYPFLVKVDELTFAPKPDETFLEKEAQAFLEQVTWSAANRQEKEPADREAITGDVLKVFIRIAEVAETIDERCLVLQEMEKATEVRARRVLEAKGFIVQEDITLGNKLKIYKVSSKGENWIKQQREKGLYIKVKRYASGAVHEYLLNQVEKKIGFLSTSFKFQRHSEIAREHGLRPDLVLLQPLGLRSIIEICCSNMDFEAKNLVKERRIAGVDMVIAVVPNKKLRTALEDALKGCRPEDGEHDGSAPLVILDAGECLDKDFDWVSIFERP